ncbi:hypothetical protein RD930_00005 [Staphylococcus aureus]|uniref:hypothetical protein n=1 Tax=Staphylococcus aureus TaxID=1280 RepID=UPI002801EC43|nr:hypothetical protein [Staphylococcus aureus]MDQ7865065.1 hypothetical protein [Staphylococcus aureus]MDQ7900678.1 hypothetical protein [Staphylococcus aureus]
MVESMLTFMLGPLRQITDFYMEHLLVSNSIVIAGYFATGIFKKTDCNIKCNTYKNS